MYTVYNELCIFPFIRKFLSRTINYYKGKYSEN